MGYLDSNEPVWNLWKKYAPGAREVEKVTPFSDCDLYDLTVKDGATYMASSVGAPVIIHNTGLSFSKLRPKGFAVHSTGGRASGPISFMDSYDKVIGDTISQGGVRHGANMGVLHVDHPDIEEFIRVKQNETALKAFNISVGVTDEFMEASGA